MAVLDKLDLSAACSFETNGVWLVANLTRSDISSPTCTVRPDACLEPSSRTAPCGHTISEKRSPIQTNIPVSNFNMVNIRCHPLIDM